MYSKCENVMDNQGNDWRNSEKYPIVLIRVIIGLIECCT